MKSIELYHVCVPPEKQIGSHEHPLWELSLVKRGHGQRTVCSNTAPFYENDLVLVPPEITHYWTFDRTEPEIESITVQFSTDWLNDIATVIPEAVQTVKYILKIKDAIQILDNDADLIIDTLCRMVEQPQFVRVLSLFHILVKIANSEDTVIVGRKVSDIAKKIEKIQTYIDCNYNHCLSINDIAQYVGINRSSLCVFFKKHTGCTIVEAINKRRLSVACNLLRNDRMTIREVCYMSGFNDYPYFCRLFKKTFNSTPKTYKSQHKTIQLQ